MKFPIGIPLTPTLDCFWDMRPKNPCHQSWPCQSWPCLFRSCDVMNHVTIWFSDSSDSGFCAIRRSRTTYGDRCFAAAGPRVWNSLPTELRQSDSLAQFKQRLKTHLFGLWDHSALWHWLLVNWRYRNILTYLLTYLNLLATVVIYHITDSIYKQSAL